MRALDRPASVYRCYAEDGELLYIGCSVDVPRRLGHHRALQPWWPEVARVDEEHFASHAEALEAEAAAIKADRPRENRYLLKRDRVTTSVCSPEFVSTKQASEISGLSVATINRWVREGRLTPVAEADGIRGARFYRRSDVEALA